MIFKVHINSENLTYGQHCVLTDFVLFKYNYCVKSVIDALKVTNDEVFTGISISSGLHRYFNLIRCEPVTLNHQISHNHDKFMILKVDVCYFALRLF
ncbi:hypothetical protein TSAR_006294 [Trichomalopsis sarcophagae]|uniref:Uncharacterized protein n=1 Tax=Trichomalopsis sarcophagae TaxID=543379 RepID=A0A232EFT1_9HYME|nr:hypothetical protein TSAR_006294 [Trichomalopsis sarcophagae]